MDMDMKQFFIPTNILTGRGCVSEIGRVASELGRKAFLVCGEARGLRQAGHLDRVVGYLRGAGLEVVLYEKPLREPTLSTADDALETARREGVDVVIGMGGGSAMDVAKVVAAIFPHPGTVGDYHRGQRPIPDSGTLPWVGVPTTAGTGAEVTRVAVFSDREVERKASIRHVSWFARFALVDPELTVSMPPSITAESGGDALTQAIESYVSTGAMPQTDALSAEATRLIGQGLVRAYRDGGDLEARSDVMYGSLLAGMALANSMLGAVHGLAHPLGYRYDIPHGAVCALLLPHVMLYNLEYAREKYGRVAQMLGCDVSGMSPGMAALAGVERVREMLFKMQMKLHLRHYGARREDFPAIAEEALSSGSTKHNPRPLDAGDLQSILQEAL